MADRPLPAPLPADLPEDWSSGQIVAPEGADVGLSEQHGYNYLMGQVNAAQRAVNTINEGFDGISGKRTCRFVIGTSTAGWTQADCDYLCDGTNDDEGFRAAISALTGRGGGIMVLAGTYNLTKKLEFRTAGADVSLMGTPGETILNLSEPMTFYGNRFDQRQWGVQGMELRSATAMVGMHFTYGNVVIRDCRLENIYVQASSSDVFVTSNTFAINTISGLSNNAILQIIGSDSIDQVVVVSGNSFTENCPSISGSHTLIYMACEGAISGNQITCTSHGWKIMGDEAITVTGNTMSSPGFTIITNGGGSIFGNRIVGGYLWADNQHYADDAETERNNRMISVSGNVFIDCVLMAFGGVTVSGNTINAPADNAAILVRQDYKGQSLDVGPCIVGNFIVGGSIGIHLTKADTLSPENAGASNALIACNRIRDCGTPVKIGENWSSCMVTDNLFVGSVVDQGSGNIIRLNNDDPGSGGGGTAGVASFNGRAGAVVPRAGDYTAAMVGAVTTEQLNAAIQAAVLDSWEGSY